MFEVPLYRTEIPINLMINLFNKLHLLRIFTIKKTENKLFEVQVWVQFDKKSTCDQKKSQHSIVNKYKGIYFALTTQVSQEFKEPAQKAEERQSSTTFCKLETRSRRIKETQVEDSGKKLSICQDQERNQGFRSKDYLSLQISHSVRTQLM